MKAVLNFAVSSVSKHAPALIALVALAVLIFWNILIKGHLLWGSDFIYAYLPYKEFLFNEIQQHGSIPMWNPYLFGGMPFWGFFESTIFYPFDILFWFLSPEKAYGYTMAIHFFMGGTFMFFLCQALRLSKWSSLFAAVLFSCNSFILPVLYLGRMVHAQSYAWMPLVLCLFVRALQSRKFFTPAIWAGIAWGMQILAADPQTAFYTFLALILFALINDKRIFSFRGSLRVTKILVILFTVGIGLSAVQLLPSLELVMHSARGMLKNFELVTLYSFPPQGIITTFMPHFFGNLYENNFWIADMPQSMPHYFLYAGVLPWFFMLFISFSPNANRRLTIYCFILALISIVFALGKHTPVYRLLFLLPGFDSFRSPSKIIALWMLALSILSGIGLDYFVLSRKRMGPRGTIVFFTVLSLFIFIGLFLLLNPDLSLRIFSAFILDPISSAHLSQAAQIITSQFHRVLIFLLIGALLWYLAGKKYLPRKFVAPICLCILLVDLFQLNHPYVHPNDGAYRNLKAVREQLSRTLNRDAEGYRVGGIRSHIGPNDEMYYGFQTVSGAGPLILNRYHRYSDKYYGKYAPKGWQILYYGMPGSGRFMDLLNVKYEIDYKKNSINMRKDFLPRALLVPEYKVIPTAGILSYMESPLFKPHKTILLEQDPFTEKPAPTEYQEQPEGIGSCRILYYRPDNIALKVHANHDAFLLLNDIYYPGWKCYVDGRPQKILRANYLFRAAKITKGHHDIRFVFKPFSVTLGVIVTLWTMLFSFLVMLWEKKKPQR